MLRLCFAQIPCNSSIARHFYKLPQRLVGAALARHVDDGIKPPHSADVSSFESRALDRIGCWYDVVDRMVAVGEQLVVDLGGRSLLSCAEPAVTAGVNDLATLLGTLREIVFAAPADPYDADGDVTNLLQ